MGNKSNRQAARQPMRRFAMVQPGHSYESPVIQSPYSLQLSLSAPANDVTLFSEFLYRPRQS